jgi:hypothetical protein
MGESMLRIEIRRGTCNVQREYIWEMSFKRISA